MKQTKTLVIIMTLIITGCASSSTLEKRASIHAKAGEYYESIGQPNVAREEENLARKKRNRANDALPLLVELVKRVNNNEQ